MAGIKWVRKNVLGTTTIILAIIVFLSGFYYFVTAWYILANFGPLLSEYYDAGLTYYLFGVPLLLMGITLMVIACIGCVAGLLGFPCLLIFLGLTLIYFAVWEAVIAGLALSSARLNVTIHDVNCEGMYECLGHEVDKSFFIGAQNPNKLVLPAGPAYASPSQDSLHQQLQCCGSNGPEDYLSQGLQLPESCCEEPGPHDSCQPEAAYTEGCKEPFIAWYFIVLKTLGIMSILICILTFAAAIIAFCMLCMVLRRRRRRRCPGRRVRI